MRMRKKKNLEPRLERQADITIANPEEYRGKWRELMPDAEKLCLEIGCGKGKFITETAQQHPENLYLALERERGAIVMAMEKVAAQEIKNVYFIVGDAEHLIEWFAEDEIDTIFINFCDPWTKHHRESRRLTHHNFLERYRVIMQPEGRLYFKTDNVQLFDFTEEEMPQYGMEILTITRDLHSTDIPNVMTEYEQRFTAQGMPINYIEAKFKPLEKAEVTEEKAE